MRTKYWDVGHCTKLIRDLKMSKETFQNYMEDRCPTFFGSSQLFNNCANVAVATSQVFSVNET